MQSESFFEWEATGVRFFSGHGETDLSLFDRGWGAAELKNEIMHLYGSGKR
jgi:hypothetical protein